MDLGIVALFYLIYVSIFAETKPCNPYQCVKHPTFISNWTKIVAQDSQQSEIVIKHNLNEIPIKLDVQVKQVIGNDTEFIFTGIGSAQRDDDYDSIYGGIVYIYDINSVILIAPNRNDGSNKGVSIFTGDGIWKGPSDQLDKEAFVRVRLWTSCDFSVSDFTSNWLPIAANQGSSSFLEIPHGLGNAPEYVTLQVKLGNTNYIADGIGCSMTHKDTNDSTSWGGVLYGYNSTVVRVWLPSTSSGSVFSAADGWGLNKAYNWKTGFIKITAWKKLKTKHSKDMELPVETQTQNEHLQAALTAINDGKHLDVDNDIFEILVKPRNGSNKDFYFKATGVAQTAESTGEYGGLVYSYTNSLFRMYHPAFADYQWPNNGYLFYLNSLWGNGIHKQKTNYVKLVTHTWASFDSCPIPTTTTTTTTTTSTTITTPATTTTTPLTTTLKTTTIPTTTTTSSTTTTTQPTTTTTTPMVTTTPPTTTPTTTQTTTTTTPTTTTPTTTQTTTTTTPTTTTKTSTTATQTTTSSTIPTTTTSTPTTTSKTTPTTTTSKPTTILKTMTQKITSTSSSTPTTTIAKNISTKIVQNTMSQTKPIPKKPPTPTIKITSTKKVSYSLKFYKQPEHGGGLSSSVTTLLGVISGLLLLALLLCLLFALFKRKKRKKKKNKVGDEKRVKVKHSTKLECRYDQYDHEVDYMAFV